jgi:cold shock CspA family protein
MFDTTSGWCFIENSNANAEIAVVHIEIVEHVALWM